MLKRLTLWTLTPLLLDSPSRCSHAKTPTAIIQASQHFPWEFGKVLITYITNHNDALYSGWLPIEIEEDELAQISSHTGEDLGNDIVGRSGTWNNSIDIVRAFARKPYQIYSYQNIPPGTTGELDLYGVNPTINNPGSVPLDGEGPLITYTPATTGPNPTVQHRNNPGDPPRRYHPPPPAIPLKQRIRRTA